MDYLECSHCWISNSVAQIRCSNSMEFRLKFLEFLIQPQQVDSFELNPTRSSDYQVFKFIKKTFRSKFFLSQRTKTNYSTWKILVITCLPKILTRSSSGLRFGLENPVFSMLPSVLSLVSTLRCIFICKLADEALRLRTRFQSFGKLIRTI